MISRLSLRKRGVMVAGVVLAGGLIAGGATAFADTSGTPSTSAAQQTATTAKKAGKHRRPLLYLRGVHGEATIKNAKTGQFVVHEWQRGLITAISGDTITVKSADGVSWTWTVEKNTRITRVGKQIEESVLKDGDTVAIVGRQNGSTNDATRIVAPSAAQIARLQARAGQRAANG